MKKLVFVLSFLLLASPVFARGKGGTVRVRSTVTKSGAYRPAHVRTAPDRSRQNNWSTKGNANPYTGKGGSKNP